MPSPRASATFPPCGEPRHAADLPHDLRHAETVEKGHGRIELRRCAASAEVVPHLNWPGAAQVVRIERSREIAGKTTTEIVYCVTSLTAAEADPRRLLDLARAHWGIENKLHWRRDVSMNEDRCRVRAGARALAALRNLVLSMLRSTDASIPAAREAYACDRSAALHPVTGRIL
jgi:predicted transposase YbfD/YdcC